MPVLWIFISILVIATGGYVLGRNRAMVSAGGNIRSLHSLPSYYGWNTFMFVSVPSLLFMVAWMLVAPLFLDNRISQTIPDAAIGDGSSLSLVMADVRRVSEGLDIAVRQGALTEDDARTIEADTTDVRGLLGDVGVALGAEVSGDVLRAAQKYRLAASNSGLALTILALGLAIAGFALAYSRTNKDFRARNSVERGIMAMLIFASSIAILTTVGIIFSLLFNTIEFFNLYPSWDFFFGTEWAPSFSGRGGSSLLGFIPLLWGTLYISVIALTVAVPIGLFAAVYLSEYAGPKTRAIAKPLIEVLAGIPTIVYGLFALLTVGPLLVSVFGSNTVGWMQGASSVLTAGAVMGIMLIPFVSSLSDDIINAVPQSMRDGSLGLGATKSETIRQVILPAALPGIVGAILLAASRAIGETMIVVLGAGAAARLSLNPFEAMTTVTAKIVSQLTGDSDFASPEALVAFALGISLFVITLGLNVFALYIVRKYREQYD